MKLPNWIKIVYWIVLVAAITYFFIYKQSDQIKAGNYIYVFIFLVWVALLLLPLFSEIKLFGIELKSKIEKLEEKVSSLSVEIRNRNYQEMHINLAPPPLSDRELKEKEATLRSAVKSGPSTVSEAVAAVPDPGELARYFFQIRFNLEKELRRIHRLYYNADRVRPVMVMIKELQEAGHLPAELMEPIRAIYSTTAAAVHGEDGAITQTQEEFVRQIGPPLINSLMKIGSGR